VVAVGCPGEGQTALLGQDADHVRREPKDPGSVDGREDLCRIVPHVLILDSVSAECNGADRARWSPQATSAAHVEARVARLRWVWRFHHILDQEDARMAGQIRGKIEMLLNEGNGHTSTRRRRRFAATMPSPKRHR
jgi:hypothetical protein